MKKLLISINELTDIETYKKVGINTFLFPLAKYSIGYQSSYALETINNYPESYLLINRILDTNDIEELTKIIPNIKVKGIVYEDIGIYNLVKKINPKLELIFFQNHFGTNTKSVNYWLNKNVDSVILSNELTLDELKEISKNTIKPCIVHLLGYNQLMYSRRKLISNYQEYFKLPKNNDHTIKEISSDFEFKIIEDDQGTILTTNEIYYGKEVLELDNIKYFYINTSFIETNKVLEILNDQVPNLNKGFLYQETIFKLKGGAK